MSCKSCISKFTGKYRNPTLASTSGSVDVDVDKIAFVPSLVRSVNLHNLEAVIECCGLSQSAQSGQG